MKKLFKNSFFSFFKNKLAISLLMIIVFLTTATFTMFNSATHAFKRSYEQVMTEGNRHDYTVKEMYNIQGDVKFTDPTKIGTRTQQDATANLQSNHYFKITQLDGATTDTEYITFEANTSSVNGWDSHPKAVIAIKLSDALAFKQDATKTPQSLVVMVNPAANAFDPFADFASYVAAGTNPGSSYPSDFQYNPKGPKTYVMFNTTATDYQFGTSDYSEIFGISQTEFAQNLSTALNDAMAVKTTIFNQYEMKVNSSVTGSARNQYAEIAAKHPDDFTYKFELDSAVAPASFSPATKIIPLNGNNKEIALSSWQTQLKSDVDSKAKQFLHQDLIAEITKDSNLIYKDVKSFKVTNEADTYKFVKDSTSEVDKIKIFEGSNIPNHLNKQQMFDKFKNDNIAFLQKQISDYSKLKAEQDAIAKANAVINVQAYKDVEKVVTEILTTTSNPNYSSEALSTWTNALDYFKASGRTDITVDQLNTIDSMIKTNQVFPSNASATSNETSRFIVVLRFYRDNLPEVLAAEKIWNEATLKSSSLDRKIKDFQGTLTSVFQDASVVNIDTVMYNGWSSVYSNSFSTFRVIDPSAFAAIVSPTYASNKGIKPVPLDTFNKIVNSQEFQSLFLDGNSSFALAKTGIEKIARENGVSNSLFWAGKTPYFILATGITPDFAFPIISTDQPIPNTLAQAIIYTNDAGFQRMKDANPGAPEENYVALGFKPGISQAEKDASISAITIYAENQTAWPTGINAVEKYDSSTENVILSPQRITFLEKLNHTIASVSWIVTSLLVLFTAFIVSLVIKKQIDNRKKQLGILLANGYSKLEIASSMMVIGLIVAVIPAFAGYLAGHWLQFALMGIFHNYWTLPIWQTQFSWITLVVTVVAPLAGMSLLAFIISMYALRGRIPEILAGETSRNGMISQYLMKPMKWFGIKTKMGTSLVFSNIGKLTIAFIAFGAAIIALSVSINSVGKFNYAATQSENATDYEYQIDLISPTTEAGQYSAQTLDDIYYNNSEIKQPLTAQGVQASIYPKHDSDKDHSDNSMYFHLASMADAKFAVPTATSALPYYLKNRIQTKTLLNFDITTNTNPWVIASQMMPENQRNTADLKEDQFVDYSVKQYLADDSSRKVPSFFEDNKVNDDYGVRYRLPKDTTLYVDQNTMTLSSDLTTIYSYGLYKSSAARLNGEDTPLPYMMSYNNVLIDNTDETYTHIDIDFNRANIHGDVKTQPLKIRGIDQSLLDAGKSKIKLSGNAINALENFDTSKGEVPIVINKYFQEFYNLHKGDSFSEVITNTTDRYMQTNQTATTFKVVAVEDTYNDGKLYTLQSYANKTLGLDVLAAKNPLATKRGAFNGVMTDKENKSPVIFDSLSLYSLSGIYPGKNMISKTNTTEDGYVSINRAFFEPGFANHIDFPNPKITSMEQLINTYGTLGSDTITPMSSMYSTVDWTRVADYQFKSIMDLASSLMNTVQGIVMFIALAFVLLISTMIIADNTRFIATLKVMGYRTSEISKIFLATFIPSLVIALIIATPLSFGLLEAIRVGIMGFGHVLIPLYLVGWEIVAAFAILVVGFLAMYFLSLRGLKNTSLLKAFQE